MLPKWHEIGGVGIAGPRVGDWGYLRITIAAVLTHSSNRNYDSRGKVISRETTTGNTTTVYDAGSRRMKLGMLSFGRRSSKCCAEACTSGKCAVAAP